MPTIVFGDDRSPGSDVAWLWINDQQWPGWRVDAVHVPETDLGPPNVVGSTELLAWEPEDPRALFPGSGIGEVRHLTADADPRVVLGAREDADLLVVGATGRGFLKRWLHLGSTAEWLMHQPPAPLLIARSARPVRRVLLGVDGSESSRRAIQAFAALPWARGAEALALGVYDGWAEPQEGLDDAKSALAAAGIGCRAEQVRGRATHTLLDRMRAEQVDLVVLGARGRSKLHRAMAGSTTSGVARAADTNVLVVA